MVTMIKENSEKSIKKVVQIADDACNKLNENLAILREVNNKIATPSIVKLFSQFSPVRDKRSIAILAELREELKKVSGFKIVAEKILNTTIQQTFKLAVEKGFNKRLDAVIKRNILFANARKNINENEILTFCHYDEQPQKFNVNSGEITIYLNNRIKAKNTNENEKD